MHLVWLLLQTLLLGPILVFGELPGQLAIPYDSDKPHFAFVGGDAQNDAAGNQRAYRRQEVNYNNTGASGQCSLNCKAYTFTASTPTVSSDCITKFCYTLSVPQNAAKVNFWDIVGVIFQKAALLVDSDFNYISTGIIRSKQFVDPGKTVMFCFKLRGYYSQIISQLLLHTDGASCVVTAPIPYASKQCSKACILDPKINPNNCKKCSASCPAGASTAKGFEECTFDVIKPSVAGGPACTSTTQRPCKTDCNVNCVLEKPAIGQCIPDCKSPTKTQTYFYRTLVTPLNDGSTCDTNSQSILQSCTMPSAQFKELCNRDCQVDGIVENKCVQGCKSLSPTFTTTATYPITIWPAAPGRLPCPTVTQVCNCVDCVLGATPTSVASCDAVCTYYDDSFAVGYENLLFPVATPAKSGGSCVTASLRQCVKKCPCKYTSGTIKPCGIASTVRTAIPWVAHGSALTEYAGGAPACPTQVYNKCSTVLKPVDCVRDNICDGCQCKPTAGPDYVLDTTVKCVQKVKTAASYGGLACSAVPQSISCSRRCPGCMYQTPICDCKYTTQSPGDAGGTSYLGYSTCTIPLSRAPQIIPGLLFPDPTPDQCSLTSTESTDDLCSTSIAPGSCFYKYKTLGGCDFTTTKSGAIPWVAVGTQSIIYSETRQNGAPATCTTSVSTRACSKTLYPENCSTSTLCNGCSISCGELDSGTTTKTDSCTIVTATQPKYGGKSCAVAAAKPTTCTKVCQPTGEGAKSIFGPADDINAFFLNGVNAIGSSIGGRLVSCGKVFALAYDIAGELQKPPGYCETSRPVLFVKGSLVMTGNIYAGNAVINGKCNRDYYADCLVSCETDIEGTCSNKRGISCTQIADYLKMKLRILLAAPNSGRVKVTDNGMLALEGVFTNEVTYFTIASTASDPVPPINMLTDVPPNANGVVVFRVFGARVTFKNWSMKFLENWANRTLWVFPDATRLEVTGMNLYGSVIALKATITGSGTIYGQVFGGTLTGDYGHSPKINNVIFTARNIVQ